ncbi:MAG: hypothetical protein U0905_19500 [Pirellulales bacterium]
MRPDDTDEGPNAPLPPDEWSTAGPDRQAGILGNLQSYWPPAKLSTSNCPGSSLNLKIGLRKANPKFEMEFAKLHAASKGSRGAGFELLETKRETAAAQCVMQILYPVGQSVNLSGRLLHPISVVRPASHPL